MKDQTFFIITLLCTLCFAWIVAHKAPFCSVDEGEQLLYQIDGEQSGRYYFQQTTGKVDAADSLTRIHYTGTFWNKRQTAVIPSFPFTATSVKKQVNTYLPCFVRIRKDETCRFNGPGFLLPRTLSVGQHLKDGYMTVQQSILHTRISQTNRVVEAMTRISVPAGDFICYRIDADLQVTTLGIMTPYKISTWYAKGTGVIKAEIYRENRKLVGRQLLLSVQNHCPPPRHRPPLSRRPPGSPPPFSRQSAVLLPPFFSRRTREEKNTGGTPRTSCLFLYVTPFTRSKPFSPEPDTSDLPPVCRTLHSSR